MHMLCHINIDLFCQCHTSVKNLDQYHVIHELCHLRQYTMSLKILYCRVLKIILSEFGTFALRYTEKQLCISCHINSNLS